MYVIFVGGKVATVAAWLKSTRPVQGLFFVFMLTAGALVGASFELWPFVVKLLAVFFLWEFTVVLNDVYDEEVDRAGKRETPITLGLIEKRTYLFLAMIYASLAVIAGLGLGLVFVLIALLCLLMGTIYSAPPLRLRKQAAGTCFIGLGGVLVFLAGYFQAPYFFALQGLSRDVMVLVALIFISASVGTTIKDIKDYEAEKKAGIKNVFTVFGPERGKKITSVLLFFSLLTPLLLFNTVTDIIIFTLMASAAVLLFIKTEEQKFVIAVSFVIVALCLLRIIGGFPCT
jgi:homogentisate phytyltransferase/homogentisate geranylgeranyltransferase